MNEYVCVCVSVLVGLSIKKKEKGEIGKKTSLEIHFVDFTSRSDQFAGISQVIFFFRET